MSDKKTSKFLSLVLRHDPGAIGLELDAQGWADVDALLEGITAKGHALDRATLERIVAESDKQRFKLSDDGMRIRANQGHSVEVQLELAPQQPPEILFHGTVAKFLAAIRRDGLIRGSRHHVHLSADLDTAQKVGQRRGKPIVLRVRAGEMARGGAEFFLSENGVWLTEHVPPEFLVDDGSA